MRIRFEIVVSEFARLELRDAIFHFHKRLFLFHMSVRLFKQLRVQALSIKHGLKVSDCTLVKSDEISSRPSHYSVYYPAAGHKGVACAGENFTCNLALARRF